MESSEKSPMPQEQADTQLSVEIVEKPEIFAEKKIGEVERSSEDAVEQAEKQFESVKGYYELTPEKIKEISIKGGFREKLNSIAEQIRALATSTKEKIFGVTNKEKAMGEDTISKADEAEQTTERAYELNEEQKIDAEKEGEEIFEISLEGIRGIRERISNPETQKLIQEREKTLDELFVQTEKEVEEIAKEIETMDGFHEAITAGRIEAPLKERIDPERLRLAVEEHHMKQELYKRSSDFYERRKRYETASDPISGRRLREEQLEKIRPEFSNPINIIENTAPSLVKKARELRYQIDRQYRVGVNASFDETLGNIQQFRETVKKEQEAFPENVQNLERRAEALRFRFDSADSREKRAVLQDEWLAIQKEAEQQAGNYQNSLDFVDLQHSIQYGETKEVKEASARIAQNRTEQLQNVLNNIYSFDAERALRGAMGKELQNRHGECEVSMRGGGLYTITNPEQLKQKFLTLQEKIYSVAETVGDTRPLENLKQYELDDSTLEKERVLAYQRARRATRDVFTHATTTNALEQILTEGKIKSFMKLREEGKLEGLRTTENYEGQVFFSRNDVGLHWSRTHETDNWAFFAATGADIFASKASFNGDYWDTHFNYEGGDTITGVAVYDPENPCTSELSIEKLQLVLPETKKEYWEDIMKKNGRDEGWMKEHVIYLSPETYQRATGEEGSAFDTEKLSEVVRKQTLKEVRERSQYAKKLYAPVSTDPEKLGRFSQRWVETGIEI